MAGDFLHFQSLKGCRYIVLSDVGGGFLEFLVKLLRVFCVSSSGKHGLIFAVVGLGTRFAARHGDAMVCIRAGFVGGRCNS